MTVLQHCLEQHQQVQVDAREIDLVQHIGEIIPLDAGQCVRDIGLMTHRRSLFALPLANRASGTTDHPGILDVTSFWREAGPRLWFAKDEAFDTRFRTRFLALHEAATIGALAAWAGTPEGSLALLVLLDQFPRNAFRGTRRMYASDPFARQIAAAAIAAGHDVALEPAMRLFVYLPFGHSEDLADQERSVAFAHGLGQPSLSHAERHRDIIRRFGRFPHRNPILGRTMTAEEQRYLDEGGYAG
ncbi:DUF924 family protein [Sabulicella glaciei]|uniref:DUF924 family protein n=1 Tax=Sabulicella glaciei TaxID=2984948 RepID=A0ABT3NS72_9PROT|nr:DUF924 family protein [Roseococcus sp. MDT2-1-1]MCW8085018.1 DUF924 family protein [Roseococcus sp. MDT2-1-1]